jgi:DNA-binding response OmpR family regulator
MRILIVDDEMKYLDILQRGLKSEGYATDGVGTVAGAMENLKSWHYDLVVLDLQLPDGTDNGLLRRMRETGHTLPVLVLTARDELETKVESFQAGADDYVVKPVAMAELAIRIRALLRRGPALQENVLKTGDLEINRLTRRVKRDGKRVELSAKEYSLLEYMFMHPGQVLSRSTILEKIWDQSFEGLTNIVDVYIGHLRRKVDEGHSQKLICTVRGLGYMLDIEESQ